jgi:hypothetical protein
MHVTTSATSATGMVQFRMPTGALPAMRLPLTFVQRIESQIDTLVDTVAAVGLHAIAGILLSLFVLQIPEGIAQCMKCDTAGN